MKNKRAGKKLPAFLFSVTRRHETSVNPFWCAAHIRELGRNEANTPKPVTLRLNILFPKHTKLDDFG